MSEYHDTSSGNGSGGDHHASTSHKRRRNRLETRLEAALAYAGLGWVILPLNYVRDDGGCSCGNAACRTPGKHPMAALVPRGHLDANSSPEVVRRWFTAQPKANIGVHCAASGFVVVDVDPRNGGDQTFAGLQAQHGELKAAVVANTGGGGQHYYMPAPNGASFPGKLGQGIELKYHGLVVLPPSNHASGRRYEWADGYDPFTHKVEEGDIKTLLNRLPPEAVRADGASQGDNGAIEDLELDDFKDALLSGVPNKDDGLDYEEWVKIGAAIHHQLKGSAIGFALFDEWSQKCNRYEAKKTKAAWNSFGRHKGPQVTARTILKIARDNGWRPLYETSDRRPGDVTLARQFAKEFGRKFRYVVEEKNGWLAWDGNRWNRSLATPKAFVALQDMLAHQLNCAVSRASKCEDEEERGYAARKAKILTRYLTDTRGLKRVFSLLPMQPGIYSSALDHDRDPWLLGVKNGVVDLRTGKLLAPDPKHNITRCAGCEYDPNAKCPQFDKFLERVQPDEAYRKFLWNATGYTLTGDIREEKMFFEHGKGDNGKSVFANVRRAMLGDYCVVINGDSLMSQRNQNSEQKRDIVKLVGARMALANETPVGRMWDDTTFKMLTGREAIPGRHLYAEGFDFEPTHKL